MCGWDVPQMQCGRENEALIIAAPASMWPTRAMRRRYLIRLATSTTTGRALTPVPASAVRY